MASPGIQICNMNCRKPSFPYCYFLSLFANKSLRNQAVYRNELNLIDLIIF